MAVLDVAPLRREAAKVTVTFFPPHIFFVYNSCQYFLVPWMIALVGTQTRALVSAGTILWTMSYYDDKYRLIQSIADNMVGGKDRLTRILSFDGKILQEYHTHSSTVYPAGLVIKKAYTYDHADRVLKITHQIGAGEEITMVENSCNELGQLLSKKLHQSSTFTTPLQKLDYSYNIRGWLNGVNKPYSNAGGYDETDLFNFELHYNTTTLTGGNPQFNGNIAEQVWKGGYDEYLRGYKYGYDKANRLKTSGYTYNYLNSSNAMVWDAGTKYDENITSYDHNGNIKHLDRFHGSWGKVDDLDYNNYEGNKVARIDDHASTTAPVGFTDRNNGAYDYSYDDNGALNFDYNKAIAGIGTNHLNLPTIIVFETKGKIEYSYDASGNKLEKKVTDQSVTPNKISFTRYDGPFVYTNSYLANATPGPDVLEFIGHDEGRIRPAKIDTTQPLTAANTKYIYDYFMKDHLGNTRMVLTTEQQTDVYAATQEPANATKENQLFNNLSSTTFIKPTVGAGFDAVAANTKVSRVNGGNVNTRIGPSIILKVMAGDVVSISTQAWYTGATVAPPGTPLDPIKNQLLTLLTAGIVGANGTHGGSIPLADISTGADGVLTDFFANTQVYNSSQPKAFLNWMIVDEEFKKITSSFHNGAMQVPPINSTSMQKQQLTGPANMTVRRNGWLYVYVSNESNQDVYFDDLVINHKRGPVVEANNYYAFGLEIPGLTSKALGFGTSPQNRKKYNGIEFDADLDLNIDEAFYRNLDPQIGRWWQVDPKVDAGYENQSPYSSMYNNPVKISDPLGDEGSEGGCCGVLDIVSKIVEYVGNKYPDNKNVQRYVGFMNEGLATMQPDLAGELKDNVRLVTQGIQQLRQGTIGDGAENVILGTVSGVKSAVGEVNLVKAAMNGDAQSQGRVGFQAASLIFGGIEAVEGSAGGAAKGLGNPFKNLSLAEIDKGFQAQVIKGKMIEKPSAPGAKVYQNIKSGYSYNLDPGGIYGKKKEGPHVDVNYSKPKPKNIPKKQLHVSGGF